MHDDTNWVNSVIYVWVHNDIVKFINNSRAITSQAKPLQIGGNMFTGLTDMTGSSKGLIFRVNSEYADILIIDAYIIYGRYSISTQTWTRSKATLTVF